MADTSVVSQQGAFDVSKLVQTQLENCVMHLFKSDMPTPTPLTPLSDFLANECDFDGYTPATIPAWADPVLAGEAWAIYAPTQTFRWVFSTGAGNSVGGYFLVLASGDLKDYTTFNPAENCVAMGQAIIRTPVEVFPWG